MLKIIYHLTSVVPPPFFSKTSWLKHVIREKKRTIGSKWSFSKGHQLKGKKSPNGDGEDDVNQDDDDN